MPYKDQSLPRRGEANAQRGDVLIGYIADVVTLTFEPHERRCIIAVTKAVHIPRASAEGVGPLEGNDMPEVAIGPCHIQTRTTEPVVRLPRELRNHNHKRPRVPRSYYKRVETGLTCWTRDFNEVNATRPSQAYWDA